MLEIAEFGRGYMGVRYCGGEYSRQDRHTEMCLTYIVNVKFVKYKLCR
jgi:hypothetical protein